MTRAETVSIEASAAIELCELLRWLIELCEDDSEQLGEAVWAKVGRGYPRSGLRRDLTRLALALIPGEPR